MVAATATATEMQNNFGKYLNMVIRGGEVIVTKNGKEVGRLVPRDAVVNYLTDSLVGLVADDGTLENARRKAMAEKYEMPDRR